MTHKCDRCGYDGSGDPFSRMLAIKFRLQNATPGEWTVTPRHTNAVDKISAGADPRDVAEEGDLGEFLGWYLSGPTEPGRGQFCGPDAAFLAWAKEDIAWLITQLEDRS